MVDVHELILRLPDGYNTIIGAGGGTWVDNGNASAWRAPYMEIL